MTKQLLPSEKTTSLSFKMLYILGILMIVDGHIGTFDYLDLGGLLRYQNYHIGIFMFVSGYFLNLERGYEEFFKRKALRLLLPLYIWNILYGILCWYLNNYHGFSLGGKFDLRNLLIAPLTDGHQFIYNMAGWFIVPLFLVQSISFMLLKPFSEIKEKKIGSCISIIFFILSLVIACICVPHAVENQGERNLLLTFYRSIYFMPAFALGYCYRHFLEKHDNINSPLYFIILLSLISLLESIFPNYNHIPSWLNFINEPMIGIYAISLLSIMFWVRVARVLSPVLEKSRSLMYCANHTFDIMLHHFLGLMCVKYIFYATTFPQDKNVLNQIKSDIWYYNYPLGEAKCAWFYITISIVIALLTGFTINKIYAKLKDKLRLN